MTPEKLFQKYKETYGPLFGITRLDYQRTGKGYWVRLGWKDSLPIHQESVYDRKCGSRGKALAQAVVLRDKAFLELADQGVFSLKKSRKSRPFLTRHNKTGIPGMTLQKKRSKTGAGVNYSWKVNWSDHGRPVGRSFAFSTYNDGRQAFITGALCRMDADLRIYGFSNIDPDEENLVRLYRNAERTYRI